MARVGFIGLGNMGGGMAANLAKKGHDVHAFDLSEEALSRAKQAGCLPVDSAAKAAEKAEAVITMLPAGSHVEQVYKESVFGIADTAAVLIDCSTIDVETAVRVADAASAKGLTAVDAPVSGGIAAANAGSLTFMVGGTQDGFDRARPFLEDMGKAVIHAGSNGTGQTAKICNNMLLGATMIATCEAFMLAKRQGLDPQKFYDISSVSSGQSWSMTSYCPLPEVGPESPADHGYAGGFATGLMLKDLRLALAAAQASGSETPMGKHAAQLYEAFADGGNAGLDFSAIIKTLGDLDG
ncbi:3-hydroxyisobutyrate dehydrogenase [Stakelama sp. CBK3Z-3]|uniref:3-hydroxyisobutyrate dehydrogenase n=1 Tax=Stakelama flava TaxID=2860338 RepID=A0ABS6XGU2_9SPHN|nr:3-hydroxyisobutyrate dehydrogenase [Stakelama flava]MBW4329435.1 3-hydroxyisobutyrate dehydrogenase [Stakelama flava]